MENTITITLNREQYEAILAVMTNSYLTERTMHKFDNEDHEADIEHLRHENQSFREAAQEEIAQLKEHIQLLKQNIDALIEEAEQEVADGE